MVCLDNIGQYLGEIYNYLKIWNLRVQKNQNAEKIFKVVQMKSLGMHFANQKLTFDIYGR